MILNKDSLNGKTHPHFKFKTLYINFQEDFIKFAFFKELVLKLKKIIYYIKRGKYFKFQFGGWTYQMKIDIHDNYVCSELNFFYFRKGTYLIFKLYSSSVA